MRSRDKGDLLHASFSSLRHGGGLGEVLDSRGASLAPWLSEPAGSLAVNPGASFLVHLLSKPFPSASCVPGTALALGIRQ